MITLGHKLATFVPPPYTLINDYNNIIGVVIGIILQRLQQNENFRKFHNFNANKTFKTRKDSSAVISRGDDIQK